MKENNTRARLQERVKKLVNVDAPNIWNAFKTGILKVCDEVCGKKKGIRSHGDLWCWNTTKKWHIKICVN